MKKYFDLSSINFRFVPSPGRKIITPLVFTEPYRSRGQIYSHCYLVTMSDDWEDVDWDEADRLASIQNEAKNALIRMEKEEAAKKKELDRPARELREKEKLLQQLKEAEEEKRLAKERLVEEEARWISISANAREAVKANLYKLRQIVKQYAQEDKQLRVLAAKAEISDMTSGDNFGRSHFDQHVTYHNKICSGRKTNLARECSSLKTLTAKQIEKLFSELRLEPFMLEKM